MYAGAHTHTEEVVRSFISERLNRWEEAMA